MATARRKRHERRAEAGGGSCLEALLLARLGAETPADLLELAKAPMDIRGYGPVKEAAIAKVKAWATELLRLLASGDKRKAA